MNKIFGTSKKEQNPQGTNPQGTSTAVLNESPDADGYVHVEHKPPIEGNILLITGPNAPLIKCISVFPSSAIAIHCQCYECWTKPG